MSEFNKEVFLQNLKEVNTVLKQIHICIDNIVKLSDDMAGADSEINEAILQLQQNVISINDELLNTYTISEVNQLLDNKLNIQSLVLTGTSGTLAQNQFDFITNKANVIIKNDDKYYYKHQDLINGYIYFYQFDIIKGVNSTYNSDVLTKEYIQIRESDLHWQHYTTQLLDTYSRENIDNLQLLKQNVLESGTNIKTINGSSILGSGDLTVGSTAHLYMHTMYISCANSMSFNLTLLLAQETAIADTDELYNIIYPIYMKGNNNPRYTNFGIGFNNEAVSTVGICPAYISNITKTSNGINIDMYCREASGSATPKTFIKTSKTISDSVIQIF